MVFISRHKFQHYNDGKYGIWQYYGEERNPCGCGSNCFHKEYDGKNIWCICNSCNTKIYGVKEEYIQEDLNKGIWI